MEVQCLSLDKFSTLPQDIIEKILILLPTTRDIVSLSFLSSKWRYCWRSIPGLAFKNKFVQSSYDNNKIVNCNLAKSLLRILWLYTCPISELTLVIDLEMASLIDKIIHNLSRRNVLNHFNLKTLSPQRYKLPSFFSLQGLEHLKLSKCVIKPPSKFNAFSTLRLLYLSNIKISAHNLKCVLSNCPLLKELYLVGETTYITGGESITFFEVFKRLPSLVLLSISNAYMKYFAAVGRNYKPLIPQVRIIFISYGVSFKGQENLISFHVINNAPNLAITNLRLLVGPTSVKFYHLQDLMGFNFDNVEELEMVSSNEFYAEMFFVRQVMATSPLLKKVRIQLNDNISDNDERSFRDLRLPYLTPRASPSINFIIERAETSS